MTRTVPIDLLAFVRARGIDELEALMYLRDANVISDHCTELKDVANADCPAAFTWLKWMAWRRIER
jgi:hypothetical protein